VDKAGISFTITDVSTKQSQRRLAFDKLIFSAQDTLERSSSPICKRHLATAVDKRSLKLNFQFNKWQVTYDFYATDDTTAHVIYHFASIVFFQPWRTRATICVEGNGFCPSQWKMDFRNLRFTKTDIHHISGDDEGHFTYHGSRCPA
jgi:hypothetical protein